MTTSRHDDLAWSLHERPEAGDYPCRVITLNLDPTSLTLAAGIALILGLLSLGLGIAALLRTGRMRRDYVILQGRDTEESFIEAVARNTRAVHTLREDVADVAARMEVVRAELSDALRHISIVRYDAFSDLGGRMSFSAAVLDDGGDGFVLTSIHGRTDTRTYLKAVLQGTSETQMSPEEQQAVAAAVASARP